MINWSDEEVQELLAFEAVDQITRHFMRTVEDGHLLEQLAKLLEQREINHVKK